MGLQVSTLTWTHRCTPSLRVQAGSTWHAMHPCSSLEPSMWPTIHCSGIKLLAPATTCQHNAA